MNPDDIAFERVYVPERRSRRPGPLGSTIERYEPDHYELRPVAPKTTWHAERPGDALQTSAERRCE